jgi:hypothetical protein
MPEIGTSGSMSGDGKRSVAAWPKLPRPSSTLPAAREALANAKFRWSSGFFYRAWKHRKPGFKTGEDIAKRIAEWDAGIISWATWKASTPRQRRGAIL